MRKQSLFILLWVTLVSGANAQDFFGAVATESQAPETSPDSPWRYRGWLQQKTGYGYRAPASDMNRADFTRDSADLSRTETQLYSELQWRAGPFKAQVSGSLTQDWLPGLEDAGIWNGYSFTDEQRRQRRWRLDLADTYLSWEHSGWWLKAGYQTFAWGEAESIKVTDVLARRDQRWPGQQDLEQIRLPVPALTATWQNRLDMVVLIEPLPDRLPAAYEEFDPYISLRTGNTQTDPVLIEEPGNRPGFALRWREHWQGIDLQLLLADVDSYELAPAAIELDENARTLIALETSRQKIAGISVQAVRGNFLIRSEQAWQTDVMVPDEDPTAPWQNVDQWRGMLGADFSGVNNLVLTGELSWQYSAGLNKTTVGDPRAVPADTPNRWQAGAAGRATYTAMNERLTLEAYGLALPGGEGNVWRLSAKWVWSDLWQAELVLVEYSADGSDDSLYPYRHNDSLLFNLRRAL